MQKTYKLKLAPQTLKYLKKIKRKYKVKLSVGPIQDFDLEEFGIVPQPGYFIVSEGLTYIYVNNRQPYKTPPQKTDYNDVIKNLQDYMLDEANIKKALEMKICSTNNKPINGKDSNN